MTWPNPNTHPEFYDPFATADRHPQLPAGYNADDLNGDDLNGSGTNWPVWPVLFDSYVGTVPLIITEEMQEVFDGCADYTPACPGNEMLIPAGEQLFMIGGTWPDVTPPLMSNTIQIPWSPREAHVRPPEGVLLPPGRPQTITLIDPTNEQKTRRPT